MNWNWNPSQWRKSTKILLGLASIWPVIYMGLFVIAIFSFMLLIPFAQDRSGRNCGDLDLIQLTEKIQNGELKQLTVRSDELVAYDRLGGCEYHTWVTSKHTRGEILQKARERDATGQARVPRIEEDASNQSVPAAFPIGFVALFGAHMLTILLIMGLMPLYIILAVKSDRLDQNTRIVWIILLCMMGIFAMPIYWYLYIWREAAIDPSGSVAEATVNSISGVA